MVCWLAPLYTAYHAKVASAEVIERYDALTMKIAFGDLNRLGISPLVISQITAEEFYGVKGREKATPDPGDIVVFYKPNHPDPATRTKLMGHTRYGKYAQGNGVAVHYAISLGGTQVVSLWMEPFGRTDLQVCTILDLQRVIAADARVALPQSLPVFAVPPPW